MKTSAILLGMFGALLGMPITAIVAIVGALGHSEGVAALGLLLGLAAIVGACLIPAMPRRAAVILALTGGGGLLLMQVFYLLPGLLLLLAAVCAVRIPPTVPPAPVVPS